MRQIMPATIYSRVVVLCGVAFGVIATSVAMLVLLERGLVQKIEETRTIGDVISQNTLTDMYHDGFRAVVYMALSQKITHQPAAEIRKEINEFSSDFYKSISKSRSMQVSDAVHAKLANAERPIADYLATGTALASKALDGGEITQAEIDNFNGKFEALKDLLARTSSELQQESQAIQASAESFSLYGRIAALVMLVLALGCVTLLSAYVILKVVAPLRQQVQAIATLEKGNTEITVASAREQDEMGDLGRAIVAFRDTIMEKRRHENAAAAARVAMDEERQKKDDESNYYVEAHKVFMASFTNALERFSQGDLSYRLTEAYTDDYESIRHAYNQATAKIQAAMGKIVVNSSEIGDGTEKILAAANELSRHTEEQASSLEETSASMEQMAATVRQNASNAQEASLAALATRELAVVGSDVTLKAVGAMEKIERSSHQVSEIIGLIEEIAFQTNILALNAAVEAARAGEAGKGFAVVANEVRALSQRSSQSLKDIKTLISSSSTDVAEGASLVKKAGASLNDIVSSVKKVAELVSEIAAASQEQAAGVDQVSRAVANMDEMTQQNAALVQETNAALHLAQSEIQQLNSALASFETGAEIVRTKKSTPASGAKPANTVRRQQSLIEKTIQAQRAGPRKASMNPALPPVTAGNTALDREWQEF